MQQKTQENLRTNRHSMMIVTPHQKPGTRCVSRKH